LERVINILYCLKFKVCCMPKIAVDLTKCNGDGVCADVCPVEVYELQELAEYPGEQKSVPVNADDCILCMACVASCPTGAITVEEE
jgi:NAD-dependent dihydropyrimidine dehydrogenase PreA subunit